MEQWKIKVIEWFKTDYQKLVNYQEELSKKREELRQWQDETKIYHYREEYQEKTKELGIDHETTSKKLQFAFHSLTIKLYSLYKNGEWEIALEKEIEKDKNVKRQFLVSRVKKITGKILDAHNLYIGLNGEINGYIIGELGKAKVETISAGGYNIQCWHF